MITRREVLQVGAAAAALTAGGRFTRALAQQRLTQDELLEFDALGNVTLLHVADMHGQLHAGLFPRAVGQSRRRRGARACRRISPARTSSQRFGIPPKSAAAYALSVGGFRRAGARATAASAGSTGWRRVVKAVRAERGDKVLLLDGGDTWQGSLGANRSQGPGHGRLHGAAQARRHDRPLGIHLRRSAREAS